MLELGNVLKMAITVMASVTKAKSNDGKVDTIEAMGIIEQVLIMMGIDTASLVADVTATPADPVKTPLTDMFKTLLELKTEQNK